MNLRNENRIVAVMMIGTFMNVVGNSSRAMAQEFDSLFGTITVTDISAFPEIVIFTTLRDATGANIDLCNSSSFILREFDVETNTILPAEDLEVTLLPTLPGTAISVALVMDTSGSLGTTGSAQARMAAREFIAALEPQDRAAIIDFDDDVMVLQSFTNDKVALLAAVELIDGNGSTSMYDGGVIGLDETANEPGNRNIILFTDGYNNDSVNTLDDLIQKSNDVLIPIHTIAVGNADVDELEEIARRTNGTFRDGQLGELGTLYTEITNQIRSQYRLVFSTPHGEQIKRERRLQLQINCGGKDTFANTRYISRAPLKIVPSTQTRGLFESTAAAPEGDDLTLQFDINGDPDNARLLYRPIGRDSYAELSLNTANGQRFEATIPANDIVKPGIECFVLASTVDGVTRSYPDSRLEPTIRSPQIVVADTMRPSVGLVTSQYQLNQPVLVFASVVAQSGNPQSVEMFYRIAGQREYRIITMTAGGENEFTATIEADSATAVGIECVIVATDAHGVRGSDGQLDAPILLTPFPTILAPFPSECIPGDVCCPNAAAPLMLSCSIIWMLSSAGRRRRMHRMG